MKYRDFALLILFGLATPVADAACPLREYVVPGVITGPAGPVAGATVEAEWEEKSIGTASTRTTSGADGRFVLTIQFDTYSGRTFGGTDKCESALDEAQVRVSAPGFDGAQRAIDLGGEIDELAIELR